MLGCINFLSFFKHKWKFSFILSDLKIDFDEIGSKHHGFAFV